MAEIPDTPRRRTTSRKTRPAVIWSDRIARLLITAGGLGTIASVLTVCVFLVWVVMPLYSDGRISQVPPVPLPPSSSHAPIVQMGSDEHLKLAWTYHADGTIRCMRLDSGELLETRRLFDDPPTTATVSARDGLCSFGFANGTIRLGTIGFWSETMQADQLPESLRELAVGKPASWEGGLVERSAEGTFSLQRLQIALEPPIDLKSPHPIIGIDYSLTSTGPVFAALNREGVLYIARVTKTKNLLTQKETFKLTQGTERVSFEGTSGMPRYVLLGGLGDAVYIGWQDGRLLRYEASNISRPQLAEVLDLVEEPQGRLNVLDFQIGKTSLVAGDSLGRVSAWFRIKPEGAATVDGALLVRAHQLAGASAAPVRSLATSARSRLLAAGYDDGTLAVFYVTSERKIVSARFPQEGASIQHIALGPKDDAVLGAAEQKLALWKLSAPHPETSFKAVFGSVWYEGYEKPEMVWQSTGGTDDFEPKYGLYPLICGTLKGTFYSMVFGAPLALLAAVYTSEFLDRRVRTAIKPTVELMASLPSVVLGFLAALVLAPAIEDYVPHVLMVLVTLPFCFLLGGQLWQLIPRSISGHMPWLRYAGLGACLLGGCGLAAVLGRPVEVWIFAADCRSWLDGQIGTATGGWMFLTLPLAALLTVLLWTPLAQRGMRAWVSTWSKSAVGVLDLLRFAINCALTLGLALGIATLLSWLGFDPRGSYLDTYVQRNALVVGFVMGFAIIPIIYTIAEDALSAVPEHLRAGSLGAGATPWQTATRIVLPTALSGVFSALMIGLGRAVGETMIVLMAAGNTPIMEWNVFSGFRTLSANIAVELPEAVQGSTHYRMLFLAALVLFVMTFLLNTAAEFVRQRFRKRAFEL